MDNKVFLLENNERSDIITIEQAAKMLGMRYHTAYKLIVVDKKITYFDYGKRNKKVLKTSVRKYIDAHTVRGNF